VAIGLEAEMIVLVNNLTVRQVLITHYLILKLSQKIVIYSALLSFNSTFILRTEKV